MINTAGKLEDTTSSQPAAKKSDKLSLFQYSMKHSRALRMVVGNLFLRILRTRVRKTLTIMYPVNGDAADDQLEDEILRNSYDYGAVEVIASGFILPPPRSINALLHKYQGPLLVFQGVLDPLNKTRSRAEKLKQQYPKATIVCVEAG